MPKRMTTTLAKSAGTETDATAKAEVEITELTKIEPTRVDGVGTPANGFPILMMKSIAPAVPAAPAGDSASKDAAAVTGCGCCSNCDCDHGTAKTAGEPKAKKAKDGGKKATKSATMPEGGSNTSSDTAITPDVIAKAVAEATGPLQAELEARKADIEILRDQVAKVLATPIPGGPQLVTPPTNAAPQTAAINEAARLRAIAKQTTDPETRLSYLELAAREEGASITKE